MGSFLISINPTLPSSANSFCPQVLRISCKQTQEHNPVPTRHLTSVWTQTPTSSPLLGSQRLLPTRHRSQWETVLQPPPTPQTCVPARSSLRCNGLATRVRHLAMSQRRTDTFQRSRLWRRPFQLYVFSPRLISRCQLTRVQITEPTDVICRVTGTTVCGSDLHLYHKEIMQLQSGDILGHEWMGIVDEVGSAITNVKKGDRVVASFQIA